MIKIKKVNLFFNKKQMISTANILIPIKAIKLLGVTATQKFIKIEKSKETLVITKTEKEKTNSCFIVEKNNGGKNTTFRLTLTKEMILFLNLSREKKDVVVDYNSSKIIIKKIEEIDEMTKNICVLNFKGGVGKTTTAYCMADELNRSGKKVLLVDLDPQASLTFLALTEKPKLSIRDIFLGKNNINEAIIKTKNFDIVPSNIILSLIERELLSKFGSEKLLKKALEKLENNYDYIIYDCPPALNVFTVNALVCSSSVIIPCETELLAMEGLGLLLQTLSQTAEELDIKLKKIAVLPTMIDNRKKLSKEILEHLNENFPTTKEHIRTCSKLSFLGLGEKPTIYEIDKNCTGTKDYKKLVEEILKWEC